jgi:transcriptional regulator with XRE-family HTH domain
MIFKDRLKEIRELNNITQKELSKKINASQSKVAMWETGKRDPNSDDIILLANMFNISADYLLGISNNNKYSINKITPTIPSLTVNETELLELFRNITNEREQCKLIGRIQEIIKQMTDDFKPNNAQSTSSKKNVG